LVEVLARQAAAWPGKARARPANRYGRHPDQPQHRTSWLSQRECDGAIPPVCVKPILNSFFITLDLIGNFPGVIARKVDTPGAAS
jgi:hypothetical protein